MDVPLESCTEDLFHTPNLFGICALNVSVVHTRKCRVCNSSTAPREGGRRCSADRQCGIRAEELALRRALNGWSK